MRQTLSWGRSLPSPAWTLVTPLLQAHPTWARDEHEGRGTSTSLTPDSGHLASPPFALAHALDPSGLGHAAHSLVGLGTPLSRNADKAVCCMVHRTVRCTPDMSGAPATSPMPLDSDRWSSDFWARLDVRCTPDMYCSMSGAPVWACLTSARFWRALNAPAVTVGVK
jgi:hypothetical protein